MKQIYILTPFPKMVQAIIVESILGRSAKKGYINFHIKNLFDYADPPHKRIDDYPFGGGVGMVMKPEPVFRIYDEIIQELQFAKNLKVIFPTPDGEILNYEKAYNLSKSENLIFINGHYKGIDQRIRNKLVTDEISIGDYVLTGGELPALIILDSIIRLIPGVLNCYKSVETDSFSNLLLDCPYYTRPETYRNMGSPEVLLSGNHRKIEEWKQNEREKKTQDRRPDLWEKYKNIDR